MSSTVSLCYKCRKSLPRSASDYLLCGTCHQPICFDCLEQGYDQEVFNHPDEFHCNSCARKLAVVSDAIRVTAENRQLRRMVGTADADDSDSDSDFDSDGDSGSESGSGTESDEYA